MHPTNYLGISGSLRFTIFYLLGDEATWIS
jgi:hypothetical protein